MERRAGGSVAHPAGICVEIDLLCCAVLYERTGHSERVRQSGPVRCSKARVLPLIAHYSTEAPARLDSTGCSLLYSLQSTAQHSAVKGTRGFCKTHVCSFFLLLQCSEPMHSTNVSFTAQVGLWAGLLSHAVRQCAFSALLLHRPRAV